jgi:prepilin-type N-terminal cleavage/methylation domain-containing protein
MTNHKKGFTLIELLVVIAIIGILSAIGLVSLNGAREKARDAQRKSDLGQMNTAMILYYDDNNSRYPDQIVTATTTADCAVEDGSFTSVTVATLAPAAAISNSVWENGGDIVPTYLGNELTPPNGTIVTQDWYCYDGADAASYGSYVLWTRLEGGSENYYKLNNAGDNAEDATAPVACSAQGTCPV